jgi:hypothetical protein
MNMTDNRTVSLSRRLYARLLGLYPRKFRAEYGDSMLQVFTDQCRSASRENGTRGMVFLWLRTMVDLTASVLREHIASPRASWGLMEAVPNAPLPWKGVALVLIPGLVFFIGQIGQLAGQDWFFMMIRRAPYFLIIPVLLVWMFMRKFPIWGLIPLGMLYRTLFELGYRAEFVMGKAIVQIFDSPGSLMAHLNQTFPSAIKVTANALLFIKHHPTEMRILAATFLLGSLVFLVIRIARRRAYSRAALAWTGLFILITSFDMAMGLLNFVAYYNQARLTELIQMESPRYVLQNILYSAYYSLTYDLGFLLLILIGVLLAWRHGRLALLLPLGYLIPTVVLGRFDYDPRMPYLLVGAGIAVFVYRVFVTLIAPIWIVRSASDQAQKRAGTIGLMVVIAILVATHSVYLLASIATYGWEMDLLTFYSNLAPELLTLAGIAVAISLYKTGAPAESAIRQSPVAAGVSEG